MVGLGREDKKDNDLFYTCSLIDYISRKTKNIRADVVNQLGRKRLDKIYRILGSTLTQPDERLYLRICIQLLKKQSSRS